MANDELSTSHDKDLARAFREGRREKLAFVPMRSAMIVLVVLLGGLLGGLLFLSYANQANFSDQNYLSEYFKDNSGGLTPPAVVMDRRLLALDVPWAETFVIQRQNYSDWILEHGVKTEQTLFDALSVILGRNILLIGEKSPDRVRLSLGNRILVACYSGLLRVGFLVVASFRFWIVVVLVAGLVGYKTRKVHSGSDVLGQTGNGRLFYSGVRVALDNVSEEGLPNTQIVGLACPEMVPLADVHSSHLWAVLNEFEAGNDTNAALAAVILKHSDWQAYVPPPEEESLYEEFFAGGSLAENAASVLHATLTLHALYAAGATGQPPAETPGHSSLQRLSSEDYGRLLKNALHQVLTLELRHALGAVKPAVIATTVLAYESAKSLAFSYEGGRWIQRTPFPHLSARAVVHSVAAYAQDYQYSERQLIRRGLIYASRSSAFAPVRLPVDLSGEAFALRQWVELLSAVPHELESVADEVEMVGLIRHAHEKWTRNFLDSAVALTPDIARSSYATPSNLLLVPMAKVLGILRQCVDAHQLRRLEQLTQIVSTRQRLDSLAMQSPGDGVETFSQERLSPPLTQDERDLLSSNHGLTSEELRDWSTLRSILNSFGWLARRVGDYTVPESSIIFAVLRVDPDVLEANELGLFGRSGMVPIRGTRLQERWGRTWCSRFVPVTGATMAEHFDDYERLLKGIDDRDLDVANELESTPAALGGSLA